MLFCACRAADVLNAFVGLWLVPKYVDPSELGAVQPLTQFANFLAIPIAAFANTFRNELTRLSIGKEFGKLKTLMRGVFVATAIFLFLAIIVARFLLPAFLERIRIVEGSLGIIIITASFVSAVAPIFSNALQALKRFKAQSIISIAGAPVRLITMLIAMPFRALSGYFIGQAAVPVFNIATSILSLRKDLSIKAEPYWNQTSVKLFSRLFALFLTSGIIGGACLTIESMILRQRLPDIDSAAYYIATRFSEIAGFLSCTIVFAIFPFAAEKSANGEDTNQLVVKSVTANGIFCAAIAVPFLFLGKSILSILPHGTEYAQYWWSIPWLIGISFLDSILGIYTTAEVSADRFNFMKWCIPIDIAYPILLLCVTGHGYMAQLLPSYLNAFLSHHNIYTLDTFLIWTTAFHAIKAIGCFISLNKRVKTTL